MKEKWVVKNKKADFNTLAAKFSLDPLTVKLIMNRGADTEEKIAQYLSDDMSILHDPSLLKDGEKAAAILAEAVKSGRKIAVAADYDCDGIFSGWIIRRALEMTGTPVCVLVPDRLTEGYGMNRRIVDDAAAFGAGLILTCDNGISCFDAIDYAASLGIPVVVSDHHETVREDGQERLPGALAVVDPKQSGCGYPFPGICGAFVAYKLMQLLFRQLERDAKELEPLALFAAIATVTDVMDLTDENRALVKFGLKALAGTELPGLRVLLQLCQLEGKKLNAMHLGFRLGPCFNAAGRLENVAQVFALLEAGSEEEARPLAEKLLALNEERKRLTQIGVAEAEKLIAESGSADRVLVLHMPDLHESIAGIVAGRVREMTGKPSIVLTGSGELAKGSGRSVPAYNMFEALTACKNTLIGFGGHAMAAGLSLNTADIPALRAALNEKAELTKEDLMPVVSIDALMPPEYATPKLIRELELLEPFGKGNEKPLFARPDLELVDLKVLGEKRNAVRFHFRVIGGGKQEGIWFGDAAQIEQMIKESYGEKAYTALERKQKAFPAALTYVPTLNEYGGKVGIQFRIQNIVPKV